MGEAQVATAQLLATIETRLLEIFGSYHRGHDVPPAKLYRCEGLIEAACSLGLLSENSAQQLIAEQYQQTFGCELPERDQAGIQIPVKMHRAPVYPSKK